MTTQKPEPGGSWSNYQEFRLEISVATQSLLDQLDQALVAVKSPEALAQVYSKATRLRWWREVGNVDASVTIEEFALRKAFDACLSIVERTVVVGAEWQALADAMYWLGIARGWGVKDTQIKTLWSAEQSRRGLLSQTGNRSSKDAIRKWYEENRHEFKTQTAAIKAVVAAKLEPVAPSTVKSWFASWDNDASRTR